MPRRSGHIGMRDLDLIAQDRATGVMLARYGQKYVVAEPSHGAATSFHGWMPRAEAKALFRRLTAKRNPPRDPIYQGDFPIGREPKRTGPYVDGDTCIVQSPYRSAKGVEAPWEVWIFGMVDPALGERWNYVAGPMGKSDAIEAAKKLVRF